MMIEGCAVKALIMGYGKHALPTGKINLGKSRKSVLDGVVHTLAKLKSDETQNVNFSLLMRDHFLNKVDEKNQRILVNSLCQIEKRVAEELFELNGGELKVDGHLFDLNELKNVNHSKMLI